MAHDSNFVEDMKKELLKEKERLESELGLRADHVKGDDYDAKFPEYGDKDDENAQEVSQYVTQLSVSETLEKELRDTNKALVAVEKGTYGICKYCKEPIDERRLRARPTSTSCVACKTKLKQSI